jgi:hypothetical protein
MINNVAGCDGHAGGHDSGGWPYTHVNDLGRKGTRDGRVTYR